MSRILAIALKDIRLLLRDFGGMFFVLIFPLIMALLFGAIFGGTGDSGASGMKIAIPINQCRKGFLRPTGAGGCA